MQGSGEPLARIGAAALDDAVEQALVEDRGDEVECRILVRQGQEHGLARFRPSASLVFVLVCADVVDADRVVRKNLTDRPHLDRREAHAQRDDDAFLRLARALGERTVLRGRETKSLRAHPLLSGGRIIMQFRMLVPFTFLQLEQFRATFHQLVHDAGLRLVLLAGLHLACEIGYGVERASAGHADGLRHDSPGHVIDQGDQSGQQAAFSLVPESVAGVLSRLRAVRVVHDVRDQSHDRHVRLVRIDIVERVETRVRRQIHQIELAHVVAFPFERFMVLSYSSPFGRCTRSSCLR